MQDSSVGMTQESYYEMCEALGTDPDPEEVPIALSDFPMLVQQCFTIYRILPDIWDTFNGVYLSKDFNIVFNLFNLYCIDQEEVLLALDILQQIDAERARAISEKQKQKSSST
jgi:hypothetical protein